MPVMDINWNPPRRDLRIFAVLQSIFFGVIAAEMYRRTGSSVTPVCLFGTSLAVGTVGFFVPRFMRVVYVIWMGAVFPIGFTVSHIVMAFTFYLVLSPIGIIMKLCGRDPMRRQFDPSATSYWIERQDQTDTSRYFRQF